jgi:hypothetical protein
MVSGARHLVQLRGGERGQGGRAPGFRAGREDSGSGRITCDRVTARAFGSAMRGSGFRRAPYADVTRSIRAGHARSEKISSGDHGRLGSTNRCEQLQVGRVGGWKGPSAEARCW